MRITVLNGTEAKGATYRIKEAFFQELRPLHTVTEFYFPRDLPYFCEGCKTCFMVSEEQCPHGE